MKRHDSLEKPCWKDKYLAKDLEGGREGDGKIASARGLDTPGIRGWEISTESRSAPSYRAYRYVLIRIRDHSVMGLRTALKTSEHNIDLCCSVFVSLIEDFEN